MEFIVPGILILIFFLLAPYIISFMKGSNLRILLISVLFSLILVPITLFVLNQQRWILPEQSQAIEWVSGLQKAKWKEDLKRKVIRDNFIFIDNSFSNNLVPLPGGNQLGNSTIRITDREELTQLFLTLLEADTLVDIILCDVYMDVPSPYDSILREVLSKSPIESKLILSTSFLHPNTAMFDSLDENVYGNIVEAASQNFFSSYQPYFAKYPSVAYKLYLKRKQLSAKTLCGGLLLQEAGRNKRRLGLNHYIPVFPITDETILYGKAAQGEQVLKLSNQNYFELGDVAREPGNLVLFESLAQRKKEGKMNIVFIGSIKSPELDIHQTYYGRLHGSTILLNLFIGLWDGQHLISFWYLLYLWLGMSGVIFVLIKKALRLPLLPVTTNLRRSSNIRHPMLVKLSSGLRAVWYIIVVDEFHFWLFIIFLIATAIIWGKIINGFALLILLFILFKAFQYYSDNASPAKV